MILLKIITLSLILTSEGRKHQHDLWNDDRDHFPISTFGFLRYGYMQVDVKKFQFHTSSNNQSIRVGFILEKTANPYADQHPNECEMLDKYFLANDTMVQKVVFIFDLKMNRILLNCSEGMQNLSISNDISEITVAGSHFISDSALFTNIKHEGPQKNDDANSKDKSISGSLKRSPGKKCKDTVLSMTKDKDGVYNFSFGVYVLREKEEGLYNLNFHNCYNTGSSKKSTINISLTVLEMNPNQNYLSAGEMSLPALYFMMAILFFLSACFWFFLLKKSKHPVFKIHYLMGMLVVIKSFSLLFHGANYQVIQRIGVHMEGFAVMYYITHLLKGALLFTVLALIGSGWAFIKHVLSSKEKKIFIIVIPLQIIANVAGIFIEETEESNPERGAWVELLFLIDFLCCGSILLPVVWSIRHLQEASQTDGKAAINLSKLKLFRHFYIMIVCYIYFTRIIVYLLRITVPFQYGWLDDMCYEMATYAFFVMIGYKFRPATNNPYFRVDSDDEVTEVLTTTGLTETVTRVNQSSPYKNKGKHSKRDFELEVHEDEEEINLLRETKESSHEFD